MIGKKDYESVNIAKERIYSQKTEDKILDDMLAERKIIIDPVALKYSKYANVEGIEKDKLSLQAFDIISKQFDKELEDHPRGAEAFGILNFIKTFNNSGEWSKQLASKLGAPKGSEAEFFDSIFGGDNGLFVQAALEGFQLFIENSPGAMEVGAIAGGAQNVMRGVINPAQNNTLQEAIKKGAQEGSSESSQDVMDFIIDSESDLKF
mgnify:CR=1 FL=1|tara:strand:- start:396 stop:1016 length:621 start_codon:yes stop_codon:yes gene_type:complete